MPGPSTTNAEWITILETISKSQPDACNAGWEWLMAQIGLGPEYFLAIHEAVRQGRWRTAENPRAYLKTVAKREAWRMGLLSEDSGDELVFMDGDEELSSEEKLDFALHKQDAIAPLKDKDGIWRSGPGRDRKFDDPRSEHETYEDFLVSYLPSNLQQFMAPPDGLKVLVEHINASTDEVHLHLRNATLPDWARWAERAGLDEWEKRVVEYKLARVSRERALHEQIDEASRKALQAAWKRFERSGIERLRLAAKNLNRNVPELESGDTGY